MEEANAAWIITGSACKKFLLSALAPQNSLRNLVTKMMSLSSNRVQLRTWVSFLKTCSIKFGTKTITSIVP